MKTRYILKTSNDLQFDFYGEEEIDFVEGDYDGWHGAHSYKVKLDELYKWKEIPFWIAIANKPYLIIKIEKFNEVVK